MATPDQIAEIEEALGDDSGVLFLEPRHFFDTFIIGTGERGGDTFLIYDKAAMIEAMAETIAVNEDEDEDFDPETSALEHFDFNMNQGGDGHPVYASLVCEPAADSFTRTDVPDGWGTPDTATIYPLASFSEEDLRPTRRGTDGNVTITPNRETR